MTNALAEISTPTSTDAQSASADRSHLAPVEVVILSYNERENLPHAVRSVVGWVNRVIVIDSGSTDGTQQLARDLGAQVIDHPWEGYARQKNWAFEHAGITSPWVLVLDSDEVVTPELQTEIAALCKRPPDSVEEAGFYINRYLMFVGRRIRHCGYFPSWNLRLFKRGQARYEDRPVHEHMLLDGKEGFLKGLLKHEDRRGLETYIAKHNRYSTLEAEILFHTDEEEASGLRSSLVGNPVSRRRFFKRHIYPRLPARWLGRFIWMYIFKLGFLDGIAGLWFCLLISSHELFITLKLRELRLQASLHKDAAIAPTPVFPEPKSNGKITAEAHSLPADTQTLAIRERQRSPWSLKEKILRALWMISRVILFRSSFHNWYGWRRMILRLFGAKIGREVRVRPTALIEIPWNLRIDDYVAVGDYAILYSLGTIHIGRGSVISQYSHLCAGTHDYKDPLFPLLKLPIDIGEDVWVAADAFIGPGVKVGSRSIVGARASVFADVEAEMVVGGNPARVIKRRDGAATALTSRSPAT